MTFFLPPSLPHLSVLDSSSHTVVECVTSHRSLTFTIFPHDLTVCHPCQNPCRHDKNTQANSATSKDNLPRNRGAHLGVPKESTGTLPARHLFKMPALITVHPANMVLPQDKPTKRLPAPNAAPVTIALVAWQTKSRVRPARTTV